MHAAVYSGSCLHCFFSKNSSYDLRATNVFKYTVLHRDTNMVFFKTTTCYSASTPASKIVSDNRLCMLFISLYVLLSRRDQVAFPSWVERTKSNVPWRLKSRESDLEVHSGRVRSLHSEGEFPEVISMESLPSRYAAVQSLGRCTLGIARNFFNLRESQMYSKMRFTLLRYFNGSIFSHICTQPCSQRTSYPKPWKSQEWITLLKSSDDPC